METVRLQDFPPIAEPVAGTLIYVSQSGVESKLTVQNLLDYIQGLLLDDATLTGETVITGPLKATGSFGTAGQVFRSAGPGVPPVWADPAASNNVFYPEKHLVTELTQSLFTLTGPAAYTPGVHGSLSVYVGGFRWPEREDYTEPTGRTVLFNSPLPQGTEVEFIVGSEFGATGPKGDAATVTVGSVATGAPGSSATVANAGTSSAAVFNFSIPAGLTGNTGAAATIAVGSVATGAPGSAATVTNAGTSGAAVFNFSIPKGDPGALTTIINGMLKGDGSGVVAAVAATDYVGPSVYASANGLTMATAKVLGRATAGTGPAEELPITGTGNVVKHSSPTLVTPILGVASATSVNKVALTTPATGSTLTIADGKTFTANNTITLTGVDGTVMTFPAATDTLVGRTSTDTLTNKRITAREGSTTSSATPTINTDTVDVYKLTAQAVDITSFTTNLTGTPTSNQVLIIEITGTAARAITWGSSFEASTVALPTTTVTTAMLAVAFLWNSATSKWRCVAAV